MASLSEVDLGVDHELASIARATKFILDVSPVNLAEARDNYLAGDPLEFRYRPLSVDPEEMRRRLDVVDPEGVTHSVVGSLIEERRRELFLDVDLLESRNTPDFLSLSIERYGTVSPRLVELATSVFKEPVDEGAGPGGSAEDGVDAETFAAAARQEIEAYRQLLPDLHAPVEVRDDVGSVMVSDGVLLVPSTIRIAPERVEPLIHHEVGTHIITYVNGLAQPLQLLSVGLARYEETQEGLAVFAEYLACGPSGRRLRVIAARVLAVHALVSGATFNECFRMLCDEYGFAGVQGFNITARVFRSGGLTKDALYLRGLQNMLSWVGAGRSIDGLWLGKMSLEHLPMIVGLWEEGILQDPVLEPRFMKHPDAHERLAACTKDMTVLDLRRRAA